MRSSRTLFIVVIIAIGLSACGGDVHEVEVKPTSHAESTSSTVKKVPPPTTTTTTVDPKVRALQVEYLKETIFKIKYNEFLAYQAALRKKQQQEQVVSKVAHSDAWWRGVSVCEQGGRNDPFFGYFSIMDGSSGGLDWDTQVQMANGIIARHGDYAWASKCVAAGYSASPSG